MLNGKWLDHILGNVVNKIETHSLNHAWLQKKLIINFFPPNHFQISLEREKGKFKETLPSEIKPRFPKSVHKVEILERKLTVNDGVESFGHSISSMKVMRTC